MYQRDQSASQDRVSRYADRARIALGPMNDELVMESREDGHDGGHGGGQAMGTVREAMHRGKHIVVKTHYEISVDGEPLGAHLGVADDGSVHYHGLPNYAFVSMVDLVRKVIDASGVELPTDQIGAPEEGA